MKLWLVSPEEALKPVKPVEFPLEPWLVPEMARVMYENNGVGLAAPQVGIPLAMFVFQISKCGGFHVVCNPKLTVLTEKNAYISREGCLTLPDQRHDVLRFNSVRLDAQDENGTAFWWNLRGTIARVVQHEFDHIQGKLINGDSRKEAESAPAV